MKRYSWILAGFVYVFFASFHVSQVHAQLSGSQTVEQAYPGFASGILKGAKMVKITKGILVASEGIEIKESQIKETVERADPNVREQLRKNLFFILEQETMKAVLVREANSSRAITKGLSDTEAIQAYLNEMFLDIQVSEEEAKTFYEANKAVVERLPFEKVKEAIQQVMLQQKRQDAFAAYVQGLGGKVDIRVNKQWVKAQHALAMDNPVDKARISGKATMVEFGATGCVSCDMMQPILENLKKKFEERLNVVFVHIGEEQILAARFGINSIPVQVFFGKDGREFFRHVGFFPQVEIEKKLAGMGVL
jgi:thiol-disulfide isomerase/thioredoxin